MDQKNNEVEKFFDGLPGEDTQIADIFDEKTSTKTEEKKEESTEGTKPEEGEIRKNRRHRRLEEQLDREREARIAAEARADALSESKKFSSETKEDEVDSRWLQIYGDTPAARQAWKLQQEILNDRDERVSERTRKEIEEERIQEQKNQQRYESVIDSELESIEDEFDIDVTSDSPQARKVRREFLELVENLSPKDDAGEITSYADFGQAFKLYQSQSTKEDNTRQREIASRSMSKSGGSVSTEKTNIDAQRDYLRSIGMNV